MKTDSRILIIETSGAEVEYAPMKVADSCDLYVTEAVTPVVFPDGDVVKYTESFREVPDGTRTFTSKEECDYVVAALNYRTELTFEKKRLFAKIRSLDRQIKIVDKITEGVK